MALVWLGIAALLALGEIAVAGSFFLLPFALGAGAGAATALLGGPLPAQVALAVLTSAASAALLIPYGRRLDRRTSSSGVGADRWIGKEALVLDDIPGKPGEVGRIRLDREEWVAESLTGERIVAGSTVLVRRVDGTRLVVLPLSEPHRPMSLGEGA
jgi:membrane protein implicated in regulation of membrane protease activity